MVKADEPSRERTLADRAYAHLRRDIVSGRLAAGSKLKLEGAVKNYGVGMSPLREALARLVGDLLVVTEGQRGFWVAPVSLPELDDVTRVRALIETEALNLSIRYGGAEWEARVRTAFEQLAAVEVPLAKAGGRVPAERIEQWEQLNRDFHAALASACQSPLLMHLRELLYQHSERYRRVSLKSSRGGRFLHEEHVAIFEAAMERNALKACRLTELHLKATADKVQRTLAALESEGEVSADARARADNDGQGVV